MPSVSGFQCILHIHICIRTTDFFPAFFIRLFCFLFFLIKDWYEPKAVHKLSLRTRIGMANKFPLYQYYVCWRREKCKRYMIVFCCGQSKRHNTRFIRPTAYIQCTRIYSCKMHLFQFLNFRSIFYTNNFCTTFACNEAHTAEWLSSTFQINTYARLLCFSFFHIYF